MFCLLVKTWATVWPLVASTHSWSPTLSWWTVSLSLCHSLMWRPSGQRDEENIHKIHKSLEQWRSNLFDWSGKWKGVSSKGNLRCLLMNSRTQFHLLHLVSPHSFCAAEFLDEDVEQLRVKGHQVERTDVLSMVEATRRTNDLIIGVKDPRSSDASAISMSGREQEWRSRHLPTIPLCSSPPQSKGPSGFHSGCMRPSGASCSLGKGKKTKMV